MGKYDYLPKKYPAFEGVSKKKKTRRAGTSLGRKSKNDIFQ